MDRIRVVEIVGNPEGGGTKCVARLVTHLDPSLYAITVVAPQAQWLAKVCAAHGAAYRPLPLRSSRLRPGIYSAVSGILQEVDPDIVNGHGTRAAWYALSALRSCRCAPAVVYSEHLFSFDARRGAMRIPWRLIERYICQHADALATSCGANARWAEAHRWVAPERIIMRHYGVEMDSFREQTQHAISRDELGIPAPVPVIGTVGRLIPQKGMRYLVAAMAEVTRQVPEAVLLVVGDGELRASLEAQCRRLGLGAQVRFLGAHAAPWRLLATCDVIAISSLFEGLPQTGLEALAVGKPVVATRMNGTEELIRSGENGLLVPKRDAHALARGIVQLLRDPQMRARFAARGPQSVAAYTTESMIAQFDAAYQHLYRARSAQGLPVAAQGAVAGRQ